MYIPMSIYTCIPSLYTEPMVYTEPVYRANAVYRGVYTEPVYRNCIPRAVGDSVVSHPTAGN